MLLTLPSSADRLACLPDCFTQPEEGTEEGGGEGQSLPAMTAPSPASESEDLVWCTPSQLLVELEARLQRLQGQGSLSPAEPSGGPQLLAAPDGSGMTGEVLLAELRVLRDEVRRTWIETLGGA
jgi:hypothetical protein